MKRLLSAPVTVLLMTTLSGCEWSSSGDGETWNDEYNWVNFNGVYKSPSGGILVRSFTTNPGTTESQQSSTNEKIGEGNGTAAYFGTVASAPVVPGSLTITAGGYVLVDDGAGALVGQTTGSGTISYSTGAWSINLVGNLIAGDEIRASYVYTVGGTSSSVESGASGTPIYSLNVQQEGNLLRMIASDGTEFNGNMGSVRSTVGDLSELPVGGEDVRGVIVASFEASAGEIRIVGTFQGTLSQQTLEYGLFDRQMAATWMESNGTTADILGVAGTVAVYFPTPTTDTRPPTTTTTDTTE